MSALRCRNILYHPCPTTLVNLLVHPVSDQTPARDLVHLLHLYTSDYTPLIHRVHSLVAQCYAVGVENRTLMWLSHV